MLVLSPKPPLRLKIAQSDTFSIKTFGPDGDLVFWWGTEQVTNLSRLYNLDEMSLDRDCIGQDYTRLSGEAGIASATPLNVNEV